MPAWGWVLTGLGTLVIVALIVFVAVVVTGTSSRGDLTETNTSSASATPTEDADRVTLDATVSLTSPPEIVFRAPGWHDIRADDVELSFRHDAGECELVGGTDVGMNLSGTGDRLDSQAIIDAQFGGVTPSGAAETISVKIEGGGVAEALLARGVDAEGGDVFMIARAFGGSGHGFSVFVGCPSGNATEAVEWSVETGITLTLSIA